MNKIVVFKFIKIDPIVLCAMTLLIVGLIAGGNETTFPWIIINKKFLIFFNILVIVSRIYYTIHNKNKSSPIVARNFMKMLISLSLKETETALLGYDEGVGKLFSLNGDTITYEQEFSSHELPLYFASIEQFLIADDLTIKKSMLPPDVKKIQLTEDTFENKPMLRFDFSYNEHNIIYK